MSWKGLRKGLDQGQARGALSLLLPLSCTPDSSLTSDPPLALVPPLSSTPVGLPALSTASKFTSLFLPQGEGEARERGTSV